MTNLADSEVAWAKGVRFRADPVHVYNLIEELNEQHGGYAPDGCLVEAARDPQNFLHSDFEWDDKIAGEKFRLETEKRIRRSLVFVTDIPSDVKAEPKTVRIYQRAPLTDEKGAQNVWVHTTDMLADEQGRARLLAIARKELNSFLRKYETLEELASVVAPIRDYLSVE